MSEIRTNNFNLRMLVQSGFIISSIVLAVHFHRFVAFVTDPASVNAVQRPAVVDAWLPISSFMSLVYFVKSGIANTVHPAGLVLFILILFLSLTMRRGFCSWICPIGTISEYAHKTGRRLFGRNLRMASWLDVGLRLFKYLLLGFFVVVICGMSADALRVFIYGPYNRIADIKMYMMFARISVTTIIIILTLTILSVFFKNFWCRYFCPYGALLGLVSIPSPMSVRRKADICIDCGHCTRACPNSIDVQKSSTVRSAECTGCYSCVEACPKSGVLKMGLSRNKQPVSSLLYGVITVAFFLIIPQMFMAWSYWNSDTSSQTYHALYKHISDISHKSFRARDRSAD